MTIAALRHLPTELNLEGILQGRADHPILKGGLDPELVKENQLLLNSLSPEMVFVSPLRRTLETANHYGITDFMIDERLIEFDFGEFEGSSKELFMESVGDIWLHHFSKVAFGEGYFDFSSRIEDFVQEVKGKYEKILIVSHGVVIRYLLGKYRYNDIETLNTRIVENNCIKTIQVN